MKSDDEKAFRDYSHFELRRLGPIKYAKALKNSWKLLGEEQEAARQTQMLEYSSEKTLVKKMVDFYKTHKRSIVAGFYLSMFGIGLAFNGKTLVNAAKEELNIGQNYAQTEQELPENQTDLVYTIGKDGEVHTMDRQKCEEEEKECFDSIKELADSQNKNEQQSQQQEVDDLER